MQFDGVKRRELIVLLGGAAAAWPLAARAQQGDRVRRIGVLMPYAENDPISKGRMEAVRAGLKDLGWIEGRNIRIDFRWAADDAEQLRAYAAELAGLLPDVVLAPSTVAVTAMRQVTSSVPIVFVNVLDPIASGFVPSLARPGGNVTGFTTFEPSIGGKWLELLRAFTPGVQRVALLFSATTNVSMVAGGAFSQTFEAAASSFANLEMIRTPVRDIAEVDGVIAAHGRVPNSGLIVLPEPFTTNHYEPIVAAAARHRLPAVYPYRFFATSGGLISYGTDLLSQHRQAASYVDRILKGEKAGDLPVQLPTKFELVINLKTAKALGIEVPPELSARADEVIE